jgi:prepilin-type N-terminal cleavage/methylation domain-containing protein
MKMMRTQRKNGFTIIEVLVVITVLGILASMSAFGYLNLQKQSRDSQRMSSAVAVSESLEKYFSKNGEYPSVASVTNTNATTVKQLLGMTNINSLIAPNAQSSNVNMWKAGAASPTNRITYSANTDPNPGCSTGVAPTDVCEDYKIQYYKEKTGTIETIISRNKSVAVTTPPPPVPPTINPSTTPSMNVALNGSVVTATTSATCDVGTMTQYAFRSRTNDGTWSAYTAWNTTTTASSGTVAQGTKYGFQAKARCLAGDYPSAETTSVEGTYIHPISTPSAPGVYTTASFRPNYNGGLCIDAAGAGNTNGTVVQVYTCNGTAAQDWAYNSNDRTIRPTYNTNLCVTNQGTDMQIVLWTCDGSAVRQWNSDTRGYFVSVSNGQCMDAENWGGSGSKINLRGCSNATAQIWNPSDSQTAWEWADTVCPAGTTVEYRVNHQMTNIADSGWIGNGTTSRLVRTTSSQGYTYTTQVGSRCYSPFVSSSWSANGASSINKAVLRPGAASGWAFGVWGDRRGWGWSWDSPGCGLGTNRTYIEESWMGVNNNPGGGTEYWLSPRTPNGPGNVWWYTANSTGGAAYVWYAPDGSGRGDTWVSHPSSNIMYGLDVVARTQYRCNNPTTGREAIGDWTQSIFYYT